MTLNVWGENLWPQRSNAMQKLLRVTQPDILLLQEVKPCIIDFLDATLSSTHERVQKGKQDEDEEEEGGKVKEAGWWHESNIYYNKTLFSLADYGLCDLQMEDHKLRGLFWARLVVKGVPQVSGGQPLSLFVSTVHLPWVGCKSELRTGINQRIPATMNIVKHLRALCSIPTPPEASGSSAADGGGSSATASSSPPEEVVILGGDFNEDFHPVRILNEQAEMIDVFTLSDTPPPITHPLRPSSAREETRPSRTLDWLMCRLPSSCRLIGAYAKNSRGGGESEHEGATGYFPASDHAPVLAFFEIASSS